MKARFFRFFVLLTATAACGVFSFSDDLDAALAELKKKAQRQIYSENAQLDDRKLEVPRTPNEEEQELDKKLREMDSKLDSQASPGIIAVLPRPAATVSPPAENKNWLLPALADDKAAMTVPDETENSWVAQEMERQKELRDQESAMKENALVEKLLREKTQQQQSSPPGLDRLKQYQLSPGKIPGKDRDAASYAITADPLAAFRPAPKEKPAAPPLFSPEAARLSSTPVKNPLRTIKSPLSGLSPGASSRRLNPVFSPSRDEPEMPLPTPMEIIRKSSPINRPNPFADDHMPQIKGSIWE